MPPTLILRAEPVARHADSRGALTKVWPRPVAGEVYVVEVLAGAPRGHHLHRNGGEWFVPLGGQVWLVVEDPDTGARAEVLLDADSPRRVRVDAHQAHALFAATARATVLAVADVAHPYEGTESFALAPPAALS